MTASKEYRIFSLKNVYILKHVCKNKIYKHVLLIQDVTLSYFPIFLKKNLYFIFGFLSVNTFLKSKKRSERVIQS